MLVQTYSFIKMKKVDKNWKFPDAFNELCVYKKVIPYIFTVSLF